MEGVLTSSKLIAASIGLGQPLVEVQKREEMIFLISTFHLDPNMNPNESPEALVQLLKRYATDPASSASLVEQLRPFRLALRSTSDLRCAPSARSNTTRARLTVLHCAHRTAYTAGDEFWPAFARVWKVEADRLAAASSDAADAAIPAMAALAGFTLSLCMHSPHNQTSAVYAHLVRYEAVP